MTTRSGFVAVVGRPNVGKSTLVNAICGEKVSIVSDKPQTTRHQVRGIFNEGDAQIVFVDTPGLHKPVSALGERLNTTAQGALADVDLVCFVIDATKPFGRGDRWVAERLPPSPVVIVNKADRASRQQMLHQLSAVGDALPGADAFFPVSALDGSGIEALVDHLLSRVGEGPFFYPTDAASDMGDGQRVAELVREQLLAVTREELPYSIATRVAEWEGTRVRCEIVVERESQKGMVIGKGGSVLKQVGTAVRSQLPEGTYLELVVTVDPDWQRRPDRVQRLGY